MKINCNIKKGKISHQLTGVLLHLGILILLSAPFSAYAGRPLSTEDTGVETHGKMGMEMAINFSLSSRKDVSASLVAVPILGLFNRLEISAEIPWIIEKHPHGLIQGISDVILVLKTLLVKEKGPLPAFLLRTSVKLATGSWKEGLGSGDEDVSLLLAVTRHFSRITFHLNAGYTFTGRARDQTLTDYFTYAVAVEIGISGKLTLAGEFYGETGYHFDPWAFQHRCLNPLVGLTYEVSSRAVIDFGAGLEISSDGLEGFFFTSGISLTF